MKKIIFIILGILAFIILGLVAAPLFINLNAYKNQLSDAIKVVTGVTPEMNGDVQIRFFPSPAIKVSDVTIPNQVSNTATTKIITIKAIEVESSYSAFLQGKVDIKHIKIINPVIELERLKDGTRNWYPFFSKKNKDKEGTQKTSAELINFPELVAIEGGTIAYRSESLRTTLDYLNASLKVDSLDGPFDLVGQFESKESVIHFEGDTGQLSKNGSAKLRIYSDSFSINFLGNYGKEENNTVIKGQMKADIEKLNDFTKAFFSEASLFSEVNSSEDLKITSEFLINKKTISLYGLAINSNSIKGNGAIDVLYGGTGEAGINWDMRLGFSSINFDTLVVHDIKETTEEIDYYASSLKHRSIANYNLDIPKELSLLLDLSIEKIILNNESIENFHLDTDIFDGKALVHTLVADLPGNSSIEFIGSVTHNGVRPLLKGSIKSSGEKFRKLINWLEPQSQFIPESQLNDFLFSCNVNMTPQKINFTDIYGSVDKLLLTGSVNMLPRAKVPLIEAEIKLDRFNTDQYMITEQIDAWLRNLLANIKNENLANSWLKTLSTNANVVLNASDIVYNDNEIKNLNITLSLSSGIFNLQRLVVNGNKAAFTSRLKINLLPERPTLDLEVNASGIDTSAFVLNSKSEANSANVELWSKEKFNLLGLDKFEGNIIFNSGILKHKGLLLRNLQLNGSLSKRVLTFKNIAASYANGTFHAQGGIGINAVPSVAASFKLSNINLNELLNTFNYPVPITGLVSIVGAFRTNGESPSVMISNLKGQIEFAARDVLFPNFDLHSIIKGASQLYSVIDMKNIVSTAMQSGSTEFSSINGQVQLEKNIAQTQLISLVSSYSRGVIAGNIDLNTLLTNLAMRFVFSPTKGTRVNLIMNVKGDIEKPERTLDTKDLDNYITSKGSNAISPAIAPTTTQP